MRKINQLAVAAVVVAAAPWGLAEDIDTALTLTPDGTSFSAAFTIEHRTSGAFVDTFTFDVPVGPGTLVATFSSTDLDIDLLGGTLAGEGFEFTLGDGGLMGSIALDDLDGTQTLALLGSAGDAFGDPADIRASYDGSIRFTPAVAIPEPQTYALMLAGLGVLGLVARRRKA